MALTTVNNFSSAQVDFLQKQLDQMTNCADDLRKDVERHRREAEYNRGYSDGYQAAVKDLSAVITKAAGK